MVRSDDAFYMVIRSWILMFRNSLPSSDQSTYSGIIKSQIIGYLPFTISPSLNCLCNPSISSPFLPSRILEYLDKTRPVQIPLYLRNLFYLLIPSRIIDQTIHKISIPKDTLASDIILNSTHPYPIHHKCSIPLEICGESSIFEKTTPLSFLSV
jgi:hypothetical protein